MIEFQHVSRSYSQKVAVSDLCLTVPPGEVFALLGPNGAGKTTTIKMLVGLLRPDSGTVRVCGHDLTSDTRNASRCLGYVPDAPFLYDKLSGREFLEFSAQMRGLDNMTVESFIDREQELFAIGGYIDTLIETYSHGMKQRLIFASALLHDPRVLVLDEPLVGLDPRSIRMVKDLLHARAANGATVFLSTHILSLAEEIADHIGILHEGKLLFFGTADEAEKKSATAGSLESFFLQLTQGQNGNGGTEACSEKNPGANRS
ncbi:MAG: ABC transporter ATP-binding protein [Thermoguttaceae bacterium]